MKAASGSWMVVLVLISSPPPARPQSASPPVPGTQSVYNVRTYGAVGDGNALDTGAIRKAIEACSQAGGGVVVFPPGRYRTGTFELKSNVSLYLDAGAVVAGSKDLADYGGIADYGLARDYGVNSSGEGFRVGIIVARDVDNVAILGRGTIDGSGDDFMDLGVAHVTLDFDPQYTRQGKSFLDAMYHTKFGPVEPKDHGDGRPGTMIIFRNCHNVVIRDVTLANAPNWTLHFQDSQGIVVSGVHISSSLLIPNDDGLDCIGCKSVHVSDCDIQSGDDDFAFFNSDDVNVTNCSLVSRSSAIRVENTRFGTFANLSIHANRGIGIYYRPGEFTEHLLFSGITMETHLITGHWWGKAEPIYIAVAPPRTDVPKGSLRDLVFSNIIGTAESGIVIYGSKDDAIHDLDFRDIKLRIVAPPPAISEAVGGNFDLRWTATSLANAIFKHDIPGIYSQYVDGFRVHDVRIEWGDGLPAYFSGAIECNHFQGLDIDGFDGRQAQLSGAGPVIDLKQGDGVSIRNSTASPGAGTFVSLSGVTQERLFVDNDVGLAKRAISPPASQFKMSGNILPPG